ncbi:divalent-cation tolerance protein CutA [Luteimonas sp. Y-2-2-4F]|nr:divalent-cation tolerance protein CutA [Luteimonas sp. Y-2-2-4F]MCD9030446.1 divalent-cation tolerance protein CutA [Luteimonas sp. Y-2-2-4F]
MPSPATLPPPLSALLCLSTCPDAATAGRLADRLVAERLAACVSLLPGIASVYRWEGRVTRAEEVQLLIKTTRARLPALRDRLAELHPYEVPELIACEVAGGLPAYLDWIARETAPEAAD